MAASDDFIDAIHPVVFFVTNFGTVELLQRTLNLLPMNSCRVDTSGCQKGEARVTVNSGGGFVRFAFERQGYAHIVREESF